MMGKTLTELIDLIGLESTRKLVNFRGGTIVYIPRTLTPDHWLVQVLGVEVATTLSGYYPCCRLQLPRGMQLSWKARNAMILKQYENCQSTSQLAKEFGLSKRRIYQILQEMNRGRKHCLDD